MGGDLIRTMEPDDEGGFMVRVEALKTFGVQRAVSPRELDKHGPGVARDVEEQLRRELASRLDKGGRLVVGEPVVVWSEDPMRDVVWVRLSTRTRESQEGEWPSIHRAVEQDQQWLANQEAR